MLAQQELKLQYKIKQNTKAHPIKTYWMQSCNQEKCSYLKVCIDNQRRYENEINQPFLKNYNKSGNEKSMDYDDKIYRN